MNNATPVFLAFLLVLSLPMMATVGATPSVETSGQSETALQGKQFLQTAPVEVENSTNRLQLDGDVSSGYTEYTPNIGMVFAIADDELRIDHDQYTIVDRKFATASREERIAMINRAYKRIQQREDELERREREAVERHEASERSSRELLQALLRNHNEAAILSDSLDDLKERASQVPSYSLRQTRSNHKKLDYHQTPLRANLEQLSMTPVSSTPRDVVVSTSQTGYQIEIMDGTQYIVETTRFDNRDQTAPDQFGDGEAYDHARGLYPWAGDRPYFQDNSPDHYWTEMSHEQGRLEFYFDSGTGDVYREIQELDASLMPSTEGESWLSSGVTMSVNRTSMGGPIEVTVTDTAASEPMNSTITVDGVEIGETGDDGKLWVISPVGTHELTAKTENGTVTGRITR
ncbi:hypothetical protein [Natrinema sp. DC36]|uniref:DUF7096 domain-containing protein n=1 Tax=Natrinema sp. DC36 TaxID=2878680 RepID=UPI001CEFCFE5|nr:hypothetical protein [Natrinema sp. DC36]